MRAIIGLVLVLVLFTSVYAQDDQTVYHLLRLDDMGMCHSLNMAIEKVMKAGIPFSTSVMFACPWYQEAVDLLKQYPDVSVGIHLTLNAEWKNYRWGPVLGKAAVPGLVDSVGYFFPSRAKLFANDPKFEEIENELRAQIKRALTSGIKIDYLDYHMGTAVQTPELRKLVESLAAEYGLGMSGYFSENYSNITYHAAIGSKTDSLLAHTAAIPAGVNLQVFHVGLDTPEMQAMKDLNPFGLADMSKQREAELESALDPRLRELWQKKSIVPITYRELIIKIGLNNMFRPDDSNY